jgi:hypothetical protein
LARKPATTSLFILIVLSAWSAFKNFLISEEYLQIPDTIISEYGEKGIDRNNREIIEKSVESKAAAGLLEKDSGSGFNAVVDQGEKIEFEIQTLDGKKAKGKI